MAIKNINQRFFNKDPEISWTKVLCPICKEPTGPKSKCETITDPKKEKTVKHKTMGILPIYSIDCVFKQNNMWQADLNYPASSPLLKRLSAVEGTEKVLPIGNYNIQFTFGRLFNEEQIKRNINLEYKTFIKEIAVSEAKLLPIENKFESKVIVFRNGKEYKTSTEKENIIVEEIVDNLSNHCKLKKTKSLKEKGK